jgi:hypothetical protein
MRQRQQGNFAGKLWAWVVLLAGVAALGGLWAAPAAAAGGSPQAVAEHNAFDFGKVVEDQTLTHTFIVKNTGDAPLVIEDVDPDCACTVPQFDQNIAPGGAGEITLTIKPFSVLRKFTKRTRVQTNDPDHRMLVFTLTGEGQPFIEIRPSHIVRLRGAPGQALQGEVHFISNLKGPFKITGVQNDIPDKIQANLQTVVPDKEYVLVVKNIREQAGPYAGLIRLTTNSKERPRLIVRVFGDIYLPSASGR